MHCLVHERTYTNMSVNTKNKDVALMQLRSYQAEMLEESLKGNCVVVVWITDFR